MKLVLTLTFCIMAICSAQLVAYDLLFDSRVDNSVGGYIQTFANADFNQDGHLDFACGSSYSLGYLMFLYGNGDGTFKQDYDSTYGGYRPYFVGAGNFNDDNYPDMVSVTQPSSNAFNIMINNGDGTFTYSRPADVYPSVTYLGIIDIDNDGFDDLLYYDYNPDGPNYQYRVVFCNGDGTFDFNSTPYDWIPTETTGLHEPFDVNHDEYMDILMNGRKLVYPNAPDSSEYEFLPLISTVVNNGDGTFQTPVDFYYGTADDLISGRVLGHFNSDTELDMLIYDSAWNASILANNGDGTFTSERTFAIEDRLRPASGDFNGDGFADLLYFYNDSNEVAVQLNNADDSYTFGTKVYYPGKHTTNPTFRISHGARDLNNDNYDDIILSSWHLSTLINDGAGNFPTYPPTVEGMGDAPLDMLTDDFNQDGHPDLLTLDDTFVYLSLNDGSGNFGTRYTYTPGLSSWTNILSGDFNKDGYTDFGVAGFRTSNNGLRVFYGGEVHYDYTAANILEGASYSPEGGFSADFNGDGRLGFAFYGCGDEVMVIRSFDTDLFQLRKYNISLLSTCPMQAIDGTDIDDDGDIDLIAGGDKLYLLYNDSLGNFYDSVSFLPDTLSYELAGGITDLVAVELNNDGFEDIAVTSGYQLFAFMSNGDGTLQDPIAITNYFYGNQYKSITTADMDKDGNMDIVASSQVFGNVVVIYNNGDGTFAEEQTYASGVWSDHIISADFNGDTNTDVAVIGRLLGSSSDESEITFLYNTGNGSGDCNDPNDYDLDGAGDLCDNCILIDNPDQTDANHDGIGDACQNSAATGTGSDVEIIFDLGVTLTFDNVTGGGTTTLDFVSNGPAPDGAFDIVPVDHPGYYQISTDAVYTGLITICIDYPDNFTAPEDEQDLLLLHYKDGIWDTIMTSLDTVSNQACGTTDGFSAFALALPLAPTGVGDDNPVLPMAFNLKQNYPNPFNPTTVIEYSIPEKTHVELSVYNILGQNIRTLVQENKPAGQYTAQWDGKDKAGQKVTTGVYFYRIKTEQYVQTKKMLLIK